MRFRQAEFKFRRMTQLLGWLLDRVAPEAEQLVTYLNLLYPSQPPYSQGHFGHCPVFPNLGSEGAFLRSCRQAVMSLQCGPHRLLLTRVQGRKV